MLISTLLNVSRSSQSASISFGFANLEGKGALGVEELTERGGSNFPPLFDGEGGIPEVIGSVDTGSSLDGTLAGAAGDGSSLPLLKVMALTLSLGFA